MIPSPGHVQILKPSSWALVLVLAVVGLVACVSEVEENAPINVSEKWQWSRSSPGHQLHLDQGLSCERCHETSSAELGSPKADLCTSCHDLPAHHAKERTTEECVQCHRFALEGEPPAQDPNDVE